MAGTMPTANQAQQFKKHVFKAAEEWLNRVPSLDWTKFQVDIQVEHVAILQADITEVYGEDPEGDKEDSR